MGIVCRPLLLYNEFLPAEIKHTRCWDYQAFGHHDGISIGKRIILPNTKSFEALFDADSKYETEESFFTQVFWGFHQNIEKEAVFWEKDYPFIYIVLLQISNKNVFSSAEELESIQDSLIRKSTDILFYHSMDNSDLIMVVKSKSAETGFDIVNDLHYGATSNSFRVRNTYSILGVKREAIDKDMSVIPEDEKIALLELQIIEKERGGVKNLYQKLTSIVDNQDDIFRKIILGTEDDAIFIRNISWRDLLSLYKTETGFLCNSNEITQQYAYAISARIMMKEQYGSIEGESGANIPVSSNYEAPLCDKLSHIVRNSSKKNVPLFHMEQKNLLMLINAFRRFECKNSENRPFTDYNFFPLFLPFCQFIGLAESGGPGASEYYYHFMKCMNLCTQNFAKPERIYSQMTDFNLKYFDMPIKFITFYNAYIYTIKQLLNTKEDSFEETKNDTTYEFMICAGLNQETEVKELFSRQDDNKRLFVVETPERQMYQIKLMLFVLGHEVAHFVGKKIRNREQRKDSVVKICSRFICLSMKTYYEGIEDTILEFNDWNHLELKVQNMIQFYLNRNLNPVYLERYGYSDENIAKKETFIKSAEFNRKHILHSDILKIKLSKDIKQMLSDTGEEIITSFLADTFEKSPNFIGYTNWNNHLQNERKNARKYLDAFLGVSVNNEDTSITLDTMLEHTLFWMKECYADIICILMLKVSLKDYINSFLTVLKDSNRGKNNQASQGLIIRIALVMSAMTYNPDDFRNSKNITNFYWDDSEYAEYNEWSEECKELQKRANVFMQDYIIKGLCQPAQEILKNPSAIFYDKQILAEILKYLITCKQSFFECIQNSDNSITNLKNIRRFYRMSEMKDLESFFSDMTSLLQTYETSVYEEIDRKIKMEEP